MIESTHYIPILKWKAAEKTALQKLTIDQKNRITPLIQLVMPNPKKKPPEIRGMSPEEISDHLTLLHREKLPKIGDDILKEWGISPIFLDVSLLVSFEPISLKIETLERVIRDANNLKINIIPVVYLSDDLYNIF